MAWKLYDGTGLLKVQAVSLSNQVTDNDGYLAGNSAVKVPTQAAVKAALILLITAASNVYNGNNSYTGTGDFSLGDLLLPSGAGVLNELFTNWDTTIKHLTIGDAVRPRVIGTDGWVPYCLGVGHSLSQAYTTTGMALAANGASVMVPVIVPSHMMLTSASFVNTDSTLARTAGWDLYRQDQQTPVAGENTLTRIANSSSNETFTASAISLRTIGCADTYLSPGLYWLVIQNRHATNTYGMGFVATASLGVSGPQSRTKTTTNPNGATLDFVTATWASTLNVVGVRLNGKVFGQSSAF